MSKTLPKQVYLKAALPALVLVLLLMLALTLAPTAWADGPTTNGDYYLQGDYIEVGINHNGYFGAGDPAPGGYHPIGRTAIGFVADFQKDGWTNGTPPQSGDYFLPGAPEQGFGVEWNVGGSEAYSPDNNGLGGLVQMAPVSLSETSAGTRRSAEWIGDAINGATGQQLRVSRTVNFNQDDLFFLIHVVLTNTGSVALESVEYMETLDGDQETDVGGSTPTDNYIDSQPGFGGNTNKALVVAGGVIYPDMAIGLGTIDSRAKVSYGGFVNRDPDAVLNAPASPCNSSSLCAPDPGVHTTGDFAISLALQLGDLAPGETANFSYAIALALDAFDTALGELAGAEVDIQGNSISIADGDITPSLDDHTDFGSASISGGQIIRTFTISNSGEQDLNLTGTPLVSITGMAESDFSVVSLPVTPVVSNTTTTFQVRFDPSVEGTRAATVTIASNDSDENPYDFAIQGTGLNKTLSLYLPLVLNGFSSGPDLVIDELIAGSGGITVTVRNAGNVAVTGAFWVDVYFNPTQTPELNKAWDTIAEAGAVWGVTETLDPDESLTLTLGDTYYFTDKSSATFPAEAQVYAYVDSINYTTGHGNVQESDETNNLNGPVVSAAEAGASLTATEVGPPATDGLPER